MNFNISKYKKTIKFFIGKRRKVKTLQFEIKNSVQYDSIITQEN